MICLGWVLCPSLHQSQCYRGGAVQRDRGSLQWVLGCYWLVGYSSNKISQILFSSLSYSSLSLPANFGYYLFSLISIYWCLIYIYICYFSIDLSQSNILPLCLSVCLYINTMKTFFDCNLSRCMLLYLPVLALSIFLYLYAYLFI